MKRTNTRWVAGQHGATAVAAIACATLSAVSSGCERKAPGPDECVAFAKVWVERRHIEQGLLAIDPFDELVRQCLTTPYDRTLVECVIQGQAPERCRAEYARRLERRLEEDAR